MSVRNPEFENTPRAECRAFDVALEAYLEGEVNPEVLRHARACPYCGVLLADLEQIRFASHNLRGEEPPAHLWAKIRATLEAENHFREPATGWKHWLPRFLWHPGFAPVAAVAALVLAVSVLLTPYSENRPSEAVTVHSAAPLATAFLPGADVRLVETLREMESAYAAHEARLDPSLRATFRESLASLDESIRECVLHCQREPGNTLAREYLAHAYQSKAQVLAAALEFGLR
jgi:hypothetical protein